MRTIFAAGAVSAGLYATLLLLAPAPAQTAGTDAPPEAAVTPASTPDAAVVEPAPTAAPADDPAAPVESATPEPAPAPAPEPTAEPQPAPDPEPTVEPAPSPEPPVTDPESMPTPEEKGPAAAAPTPEPAVGVTPPPDARVPAKRAAARRRPAASSGDRPHVAARKGDTRSTAARTESHRVPNPAPTPAEGSPAPASPGFSLATPGAAPIGVPDFFIEKFRIPPFLLPIYQAAGSEYGVPWQILAAINEIETDYGRNLNVSSAGAVGWMQFMPATWDAYGVDASGDGVKDPFNPADAIFAAARYLDASGAATDIRKALFAYNHADWYVDSVLLRAEVIGRLPTDLVSSLTGLTEGRFPVQARAWYAGPRIHAREGARVVAVANGRIVEIGHSERLGRHLVLQDVYGNTYTYGNLGETLEIDPSRPKGVRVTGGTVLGSLGPSPLRFEIRPAGRGAPRIDPKPILDGWKLLESTAAHRARGSNPFFGADAERPTVGQLLLLGKEQLIQQVVNDPRIKIYGCGIGDIRSGQIDRRVLATMLYLAASGLNPTISSLKCGHGRMTASGNVSEHSTGTAMDIAAVNGVVISPSTQGSGSITDMTIRALLELQGTMRPHQIISLMTYEDADNTLAMSDHADHIHVGWRPLYDDDPRAPRQIDALLRPDQWIDLIDRLGDVVNPPVREQPSRFAVNSRGRR
jgi:murein DD-endopeptidase MepM/ murein hydrolase activator NlpD